MREVASDYCSIRREAEEVMKEIGEALIFEKNGEQKVEWKTTI